MEVGHYNKMIKKKYMISGLSILEALVSTVIVGIGFIAILQMTNFSVQSIDNSGERTKANFLTEMIAEDVIGSKDSYYGEDPNNKDIRFNAQTGEFELDGKSVDNFSSHLSKTKWTPTLKCGGANTTTGTAVQKKEDIYESQKIDAPRNKMDKWNTIFQENRFLKCKSSAEEKKLQVFKICRWNDITKCHYKVDSVYDEPLYMGRVEMRLNNGKKRKYLYFQTDYKLKK